MSEVKGLRKKVFKGVSWLAVSKTVNRGFVFVTTLVLARLLSPVDFGLVASALVVLNFLTLFNESGIGTAIAQSKELEEEDLSSVFWPNLVLGILLFLSAFLLSRPASLFFSESRIGPVLVALSFTLVIDSFGLVQAGLLSRRMNFRALSLREMLASFGYGVAAISGAVAGLGVWALVLGYLIKSLVGAVTLWFSVSWRPGFSFNLKVFKRIYSFGVKIMGNGFVEFFRRNTDRALIGRFLGTSALGVYSIAYNLMMIPRDQMTPLVTRVLLPAYSKLQDDNKRLEAAYLRAVRYVSFLTIPAAFGLAAVAPEFVEVLFGSKWMGAAAPIRYLSVAGALLSINPILGYVLVAKGRPGIFVAWNFVRTVITAGFLFVGVSLGGLNGVAAAFSLAVLLDTPITQYISIRSVGGKLKTLWATLLPVFEAAFLMTVSVTIFRLGLLSSMVSKGVILVTSILFGICVYFVGLWLGEFKVLGDIRALAVRLFKRS